MKPAPSWPPMKNVRSAQHYTEQIGIELKSIFLSERKRITKTYRPRGDDERFMFSIRGGVEDDRLAQRFADATMASLALLTSISPQEPPLAIRLPSNIIVRGNIVRYEDIQKYHGAEIGTDLWFRLRSGIGVAATTLDEVWRVVPVVVQEEDVFDATSFYQASISDFCFLGDDIWEVLSDDLSAPFSSAERSRAENALLNAFKAIEAIVGDPPKDERRLRQKLREAGIDPEEPVGYQWGGAGPPKEPIIVKVGRMSSARDKRAAHARTGVDRTITYYELMDSQGCAQAVLSRAIEFRMASAQAARRRATKREQSPHTFKATI